MGKKVKVDNTALALIYVVVGILLCIFKAQILNWILTGVGVLFLLHGILQLVHKLYNEGIIYTTIGLVIILGGWMFLEVLFIVIGVLLV